MRRLARSDWGTGGWQTEQLAQPILTLRFGALPANPAALLRRWLAVAKEGGDATANACVLATASAARGPSARSVLCHDASDDGLLFGAFGASEKALALLEDPRAEAVFRFGEREVRVRGAAAFHDDAGALYAGLPTAARHGLHVIDPRGAVSEDAHEASLADFDARARSAPPEEPPPDFVAFSLVPARYEFYAGGHEGYLVDRFRYDRGAGGEWGPPVRREG